MTALIIPALNEERVIGSTLDAIPPGLFGHIIVADNGSTDRTAEVALAHGAHAVRIPERGYGAACLAALETLPPDVDIVVFMQADGSEDPLEASALVEPIRENRADLVLGSRTLGRALPGSLLPHQRWGNRITTELIRLLHGRSFSDLGPFRAIRLDALRRLRMRERAYGWTVEMQVRALLSGLRIIEVPVSYRTRVAGENKVSGNWKASIQAGARMLSTVVSLRFIRQQ